jgi:hypothetical protein
VRESRKMGKRASRGGCGRSYFTRGLSFRTGRPFHTVVARNRAARVSKRYPIASYPGGPGNRSLTVAAR